MTTAAVAGTVAELRQRRRELRRELARVTWWLQLVKARRDLVIARLADAAADSRDLDTTWEALVADAPSPSEIATVVWPEGESVPVHGIQDLDAIAARLSAYESRLSDNLDTVTSNMVAAMSAVNASERHG